MCMPRVALWTQIYPNQLDSFATCQGLLWKVFIHSAHVPPACLTALLRMGVGAGLTGATGATGLTGATGSVLLTIQGNYLCACNTLLCAHKAIQISLELLSFLGQ